MDETRDITILGAGPVGLSAAFWAGMRQASARIVDALPELGGQLTALYPEKWIYDVVGHRRILAAELVAELEAQSIGQFGTPVHLATQARGLRAAGDELVLETDRGDLRTRTLIVAGGHGTMEPRPLPGLDGHDDLHYVVADKQRFAGRRVVVVGGGDSALDWTLNLLGTAAHVTLVHRRERFRAHEATLAAVMAAVEAGHVDLRVPARVIAFAGGRVTLDTGEVLAADALLPQLGFVTRLGPLAGWGLELDGQAIRVDAGMRTSLPRVFACGDVAAYEGKLKLIATGFAEAATAVAGAVRLVRPDEQLQPGYSTNTGVPGVVAGQA